MLLWKEVRKAKKESEKNLQRIIYINNTFVAFKMDVRRAWNEHFRNLHNIRSYKAI